ncbi:hypothetical protein VP1G_10916 [Cytospora mali]|uniref:F-box domain-containing protein n=1 Tax=Cytospora mali TaxID=578113 RepID=A0A194V0Y0_CYTMA|nr:hypothetical protein VP1G_10916 [Valsa mali var. pyri (nom. inval.)]
MNLTNDYSSLPEASGILPGIHGVDAGTASDKRDHNPVGIIDEYQEADGQDRGTGPISKGAVREDAQLIYRPLHYLNSTVTISDPPKSPTFAATDRIPGPQSSRLLGLPIEIQQLIYNNLNTTSLLRFSQMSRVTHDIVSTFPAWRHLSDHSLEMLAAMSKMKLLHRHTVAELYETLSSARCVGCPSRTYGAYVFLPTTDRCCWVCISYHPMFRVISLRKASKTFAISISRIKRELYVFQSIPGMYDKARQVSLASHKLVCAREAGELGLRVHGSLDKLRTAADVFLRDVNPPYRREATYLQSAVGAELGKVSPWSWAPSTNLSSSQRPMSEVAIFDENFGKAAMLVSQFRPGVGVEQPLWCKGCYLVLEAYENQSLSDEFILENIINENKELDIRHDIENLDLGDILRCLAKQARSPAELYDHAKYCYGARKMLWDAGSQVRLFISEPSDHRSRNPLDLSTIVDSGGCAHIVNDLGLLEHSSLMEANDDDFIVSGGRRIKVVFRGRRIMKGLLDGQHGSQRQDLVLENVAYVPGFDSNIISSSVLKKNLGYWVCGYDNTLRSGSYDDPRILLQLPEISNVTVAEYKEDPESKDRQNGERDRKRRGCSESTNIGYPRSMLITGITTNWEDVGEYPRITFTLASNRHESKRLEPEG